MLSLQRTPLFRPIGSNRPINQFLRRSVFHRSHGHDLQIFGLKADTKSIHNTSLIADRGGVRMSALLQKHLGLSRRQSERMILTERITLYGKVVTSPSLQIQSPGRGNKIAIKVDGKLLHDVDSTLETLQSEQEHNATKAAYGGSTNASSKRKQSNVAQDFTSNKTRVWLCNKLKGELVTEDDPDGRPSMLQRLIRGGVGEVNNKTSHLPTHLKPVGRLDMMTEGLIIITNDGQYARELELPTNQLWRTYRVRVHGRLTLGKLNAMRTGVTVRLDDEDKDKTASGEVVKSPVKTMKYKGIKVSIERKSLSSRRTRRGSGRSYSGSTNTWLQITCTEGKNRMLRRILNSLGLDVTRLIRISYGDYDLNTIPPGRAVEVPCKILEKMKKRGSVFASVGNENKTTKADSRKGRKLDDIVNTTSADGDGRQINAVQWINYS